MRKVEEMTEKRDNINPEVVKREHQLFCPYCSEEMFRELGINGGKGQIVCEKCKKNFGFTFGRVTQPVEFIGYMNVQGRLMMAINNSEEIYNLNTDKKMQFKRGDEILILWKKGVFNEYRAKEIINYTNHFRTAI